MRTKTGIISSAKMTGTVAVTVHSHAFHPKYRKRYRVSTKFLADTNGHTLHEGDQVVITECRPLSKNKYFKVTDIVKKTAVVSELKNEEVVEKAVHREKEAPVVEKKKEEATKDSKETEKTDSPEQA